MIDSLRGSSTLPFIRLLTGKVSTPSSLVPPSIWTDGANQRTGKRPPVLLQALGAGPKVAAGIQRPPGGVKFLPDFFQNRKLILLLDLVASVD